MRQVSSILVFGFLLSITGETRTAPLPPEKRQYDFEFPTKVGTRWVYHSGDTEVIEEIISCVTAKDGVVISVADEIEGKLSKADVDKWIQSTSGLFKIASSGTDFDVHMQFLKYPVCRKDTWKWGIGEKGMNEVCGLEWVTVPAGRYKCIHVKSIGNIEGNLDTEIHFWYCDSVGIVQIVRGEWSKKLVSITIPKPK